MENCEPLIWYGALVIFVTGSFIVIPFLRRKGELLSAWNILLLGVAIYLGLGCFEAASTPIRFPTTQWFQPTKDEVTWFLVAATIFLAVLIPTYYYNPLSRFTARAFNKWPPQTTPTYLWVIVACFVILALIPLTAHIFFVGAVMAHLSHKAMVFAVVFSFMLWLRQPRNLVWLALLAGAFLICGLQSMLIGGGRRVIIAVLSVPVICIYMTYMRHWRPTRSIVAIGIATVTIFVVGLVHNSVRHFAVLDRSKEFTAKNLINELRNVSEKDWLGKFTSDRLRFVCQSNVHYGLFTRRVVQTGELEAKPLNTLAFLIAYPVPRQVWQNKPRPVGGFIVETVVRWPFKSASWGVGIGGHAAYEGGLWAAALYAFLAAIGVRFLDDPLQRQPTNPFLIAIFVSAAPHILGWPRGGFEIMAIEAIECFLFAVLLGIGGRILFGTDRNAAKHPTYFVSRTVSYGQSIR